MTHNNTPRLQSVVTKPPVYPFSKPQAIPQNSSQASSSHSSVLSQSQESWNPEIVSYGVLINPLWSKEERLRQEVLYFGHFIVKADSAWTQAEVNAEVARRKEIDNAGRLKPTLISPAFVLNWDFKPE